MYAMMSKGSNFDRLQVVHGDADDALDAFITCCNEIIEILRIEIRSRYI